MSRNALRAPFADGRNIRAEGPGFDDMAKPAIRWPETGSYVRQDGGSVVGGVIRGQTIVIDGPGCLYGPDALTSGFDIEDCYIQLNHPDASLVRTSKETHGLRIKRCQVIRHPQHRASVVDIDVEEGNVSQCVFEDVAIAGGDAGSPVAIRMHNRAGGSPHHEFRRVAFSTQYGGCLDLGGIDALLWGINHSDLPAASAVAPGILIAPETSVGGGTLWGRYELRHCTMVCGHAAAPDLQVEDGGGPGNDPGAVPLGVHYSRFTWVDMHGAGEWDFEHNHISNEL